MNIPNSVLDVLPGVHYIFNPVHRNKMVKKSQWSINYQEELASFILSQNQIWVFNDCAWGFHYVNDQLAYLGVAQDHLTQVFIAKFTNDVHHNNWHGYPADHEAHAQDIPDETILKDWLDKGILPLPKIKKLAKGKPCKL